MDSCFDDEEWKPIEEFSGRYEISSHGRVRRCFSYKGFRRGGLLTSQPLPSGYLQVNLYYGDRRCAHRYIHLLVLTSFVCCRPRGLEANHIDGDKRNNHLSNLEWVTRSQNARHRHHVLGKHAPLRRLGIDHHKAKLTEEDVRTIRERAKGGNYAHIAQDFGVTYHTVSAIARRIIWRHVE